MSLPGIPEAFSLYKKPLYVIPYRPDLAEGQQKKLDKAIQDFKEDQKNVENYIWLGRQLAYMGRYREGIATFTMGLEKYPEDAELYRHRAHRFLTLRLFDHAVTDSILSIKYMMKAPDKIEYSGIPIHETLEIYSLYTNTYYHLGLTYYAQNELEKAEKTFQNLMDVAMNDDHIIMGAYWRHMILHRLGRKMKADDLLATIQADMDVIVAPNYHQVLLAHKGEMDPEDILKKGREESHLGITASGNGIANYYLIHGDKDKYIEILREVVSTDAWSGFGYIIAEADLKRQGIEI